MKEAVTAYLRLFNETTFPGERTPERLAEVLDRLAVAFHETKDVAPATNAPPPSLSYAEARERVRRSFPDFGVYAVAAPEDLPPAEVMVGDAIDDLADIYNDLSGVAWLLQNGSEADAIWQFRFDFQSHWGRHLLNLRSYLHWRLYEH